MMFPLDGVVADAAGQRMAGRVGVDLLCILGPVSASGAETAALVPAAALAGPPAFDTMFNRTGMRSRMFATEKERRPCVLECS